MIDTIEIKKEITNKQYETILESGLVRKHWDNSITGKKGVIAELRNLDLYANDSGVVTIKGSFCKFVNGDNQQTLSHSSICRGIDEFDEMLPINLPISELHRIDISDNLLMNVPSELYWKLCGITGRFKRNDNNNGITYQLKGKNKEFCIYGKIEEQKEKRVKIHDIYSGANLLRLELRYKNRIEKEFGRKLFLQDLKDPALYLELVKRWKEAYDSINKYKKPILHRDFLKGSKVFDKMVLTEWIETNGGELAVLDMIDRSVKLSGKISDSEQQAIWRHKDRIKEICRNPNKTETVDLIKELDEKVNIVVEFHRALL